MTFDQRLHMLISFKCFISATLVFKDDTMVHTPSEPCLEFAELGEVSRDHVLAGGLIKYIYLSRRSPFHCPSLPQSPTYRDLFTFCSILLAPVHVKCRQSRVVELQADCQPFGHVPRCSEPISSNLFLIDYLVRSENPVNQVSCRDTSVILTYRHLKTSHPLLFLTQHLPSTQPRLLCRRHCSACDTEVIISTGTCIETTN